MKLVSTKCPSCGNSLKINTNSDYITCDYCKSNLKIDNNIKKIQIEFIDDQEIDNAFTYLNNFKDYKRASECFRNLSEKFVNNSDIWFGFLKSLTNDFEKGRFTRIECVELASVYEKVISLLSEDEKKLYKNQLKQVKSVVDNFKVREEERIKIKNRNILISCGIAFVLVVTFITISVTMPTKQLRSELKYSEVQNKCKKIDSCDLNKLFKKNIRTTFASLKSNPVLFDYNKKEYEVEYIISSIFTSKKETFKFTIEDDMAPKISYENCNVEQYHEFDLKCINIVDYKDGVIELNKENLNFSNDKYGEEIGNHNVKVNVEDSDNLKTELNIAFKTVKTKFDSIQINSNDTVEEGDRLVVTGDLKSSVIPNKEYKIKVSDESIINKDLKALGQGTTKICVISEYDDTQSACKNVKVGPKCKSVYQYSYDGSKESKLVVGSDICAGTYKVYAPSVLNDYDAYYVRSSEINSRSILIWKTAPSLSGEGGKMSVSEGQSITVPAGIVEFKLVRTN